MANLGWGDQGVTMAPWRQTSRQRGGQMVLACGGRARSDRSRLPQRSRRRQIGKGQADRGRSVLKGDFRGVQPAGPWSLAAIQIDQSSPTRAILHGPS